MSSGKVVPFPKKKKEEKPKDTVIVRGTAEVVWSVEIPVGHEWDGQACPDPAVEAVICSGASGEYDVFLFGVDKPPVNVYLDVEEEDIHVEDDPRDPPPKE